jgi:hypothetical protein
MFYKSARKRKTSKNRKKSEREANFARPDRVLILYASIATDKGNRKSQILIGN